MAGTSQAQLVSELKDLDLNDVGIYGRTPLMASAAAGLLAAVETLVRNGASVHATGRAEMTALHEAAASGDAAIASYLLSAGANVDAKTVDGVTPLMCAAAWGNTVVVKLLLDNHADPTAADRTGATAADIAREKGEDDAADLINSYSLNPKPGTGT
ncbi:ankyrin repeat domain-containing protein [Roseateles sp. MS654]|uniref:ankyrin repeat domain-containing protein n=1 Tax=Roseateles sp. MS654 TaxID=3412685 RepID=UPI003C2CBC1F